MIKPITGHPRFSHPRFRKYFKPNSLSWWAGFIPVIMGATIAAGGEVEPLRPLANVLQAMWGVSPAAMISLGLGMIGLRGKDG